MVQYITEQTTQCNLPYNMTELNGNDLTDSSHYTPGKIDGSLGDNSKKIYENICTKKNGIIRSC